MAILKTITTILLYTGFILLTLYSLRKSHIWASKEDRAKESYKQIDKVILKIVLIFIPISLFLHFVIGITGP